MQPQTLCFSLIVALLLKYSRVFERLKISPFLILNKIDGFVKKSNCAFSRGWGWLFIPRHLERIQMFSSYLEPGFNCLPVRTARRQVLGPLMEFLRSYKK
jgi:hypothetical protein